MAYFNCVQFWPDMNIDRNETGLQIFTKYFNKINQDTVKQFIEMQAETGKSESVSNKFRMLGMHFYNEKKHADAINCYTNSIAYAPQGSIEFGLTLACRLAILFDLERYQDCLVDIRRILERECLKDMFYKIYTCQAKCYLELKYYAKTYEAIKNAKSHFEIAKATLKKVEIDQIYSNIMEIKETLENNLKTDEDVASDEQPSLPDLTNGENPQFAYASNMVTMKKSMRRGRHVVANADIKKGDVLFVEEPYSTGLFVVSNGCFIYCSHCFTCNLTCIPCASCTLVFYCTDECRQLSWEAKHRWQCASIRKNLIAFDQSLVLGILFRASHTGFNTTIRDARVYGNKQDNYPYMNLLMTHKNDIPYKLYMTYVKVATFLVIYLMHFTDYFDWLHAQENRSQRSRDHLYRMVGGFLLKYLSQVDSNCEKITDVCVVIENKNTISLSSDVIAHALYVSSSLLSHSCIPNAVKSFHGSTKIVSALSDIKKGSEVTINYLASQNPAMLNADRASELKKRFYFSCSCRVCVDEESFFPWLCPSCEGRALPTSDDINAKCSGCGHVFKLSAYRIFAMKFLKRAEMYLTPNLKRTVKYSKQIFHPTNPFFWPAYYNLASVYRSKGEFKASLKYIDLAIDLYKSMYGDTVSQCMLYMILERCLTLVNYCLAVRRENPTLHKQVLTETTDFIVSTRQILKHHMLPQHIDCCERSLMEILNTEDACLDNKIFVFHSNRVNIHFI